MWRVEKLVVMFIIILFCHDENCNCVLTNYLNSQDLQVKMEQNFRHVLKGRKKVIDVYLFSWLLI